MTYPENTTQRDQHLNILGIMSEGQGGYIEGMEAQGQRQFVASSTIPTECDEAALTALGFVLGNKVPGDDLFRYCTLPTGWSKAGTDHSMHSGIADELGRKRVGVFYKAAFYDRRATATVIQLSGYLQHCAWHDEPVVYDEVWASPATVFAEAERVAASYRTRAEEYRSYYPAGVERELAEALKFDAIAAAAREVTA